MGRGRPLGKGGAHPTTWSSYAADGSGGGSASASATVTVTGGASEAHGCATGCAGGGVGSARLVFSSGRTRRHAPPLPPWRKPRVHSGLACEEKVLEKV